MLNETIWMPDRDVLAKNLTVVMGKLEVPANYMVLDIETTGFSPVKDDIWQFGAFTSMDGSCKHAQGVAFHIALPDDRLRRATFEIGLRADRLVKTGMSQEEAHEKGFEDFKKELAEKGKDAKTQIGIVVEGVKKCVTNGWPLVGHNCINFDLPFVVETCKRFGIEFSTPTRCVVDTGTMIKAAKLKITIGDGEDLISFYRRVNNVRAKGCYYNLGEFCVQAFQLTQKYGVDVGKAHDAGYDCYLTSLVLRELVDWAKGNVTLSGSC